MNLTPRQLEILRLWMTGKEFKQIADSLKVSEKTIWDHWGKLKANLGIYHAALIARFAIENGYV